MELTKDQINSLVINGYTHLPQFAMTEKDRSRFREKVIQENKSGYFSNYELHTDYLKKYKIIDKLNFQLIDIAKQEFNYWCNEVDIYKITRIVRRSNRTEQYRFHFDSHLFTLVTPVNIPKSNNDIENGALITFPNLRKEPISETKNVITKLYYKGCKSKKDYENLSKFKKVKLFNFSNYEPVLFLGRSSLHANSEFKSEDNSPRITTLTHFFDPSPSLSLGRIIRKLRNR